MEIPDPVESPYQPEETIEDDPTLEVRANQFGAQLFALYCNFLCKMHTSYCEIGDITHHLYQVNFPWLKAVTELVNSFNLECTHQTFCHPACFR